MQFLSEIEYRYVTFNLGEFLKFQNLYSTVNYYQKKQLIQFVENLHIMFIQKSFNNLRFQTIVSIPQLTIQKFNRKI